MEFNHIIPELCVMNIERSLHFYTKILPFLIEYQRSEAKFAFLSLGKSQLMIEQLTGTSAATDEEILRGEWRTADLEYPLGRGVNFQIKVESLDKIVQMLEKASYPLKMKPREKWYRKNDTLIGDRQILVMDPDGYLLRFCEDIGEKPASTSIAT